MLASLHGKPAVSSLPPELVLLTEHLSNSPVTAHQICNQTWKDPDFALVLQFVQQGWSKVAALTELYEGHPSSYQADEEFGTHISLDLAAKYLKRYGY